MDIQKFSGFNDGFCDCHVISIYMEYMFDVSFFYLYSEIKGW